MTDRIIERFRETHHAIARMVAAGMTPAMIRRYTGVTQRRLTLQLADPAFNDLIAYYAKKLHERLDFEDDIMGAMLRANAIRAEFTVQEHFEEAADRGELVPLMQADKISQERADRIGYGKHSTIQHNHDFATALERAITRSGKSEEMKIIDVKASAVSSLAAPLPSVVVEPAQPPPEAEAIGKPQPPSFAGVLRRRVA